MGHVPAVQVFDDLLPDPERMRQSALRSGFGSWRPNVGDMGALSYDGVNFWGEHVQAFAALHARLGQIIPSSMFFRLTNHRMERGRIHCDREYGERTAVLYLSDAPVSSGTAFYRHRETGMTELPPYTDLARNPPLLETLKQDMLSMSPERWEVTQFVEAKRNRCVVFNAPLLHCRIPMDGYGLTDSDSRMVWVAHFSVPT